MFCVTEAAEFICENSLCSFNMIFFKCLVNEEYCNSLCLSHHFKHLHCQQPIIIWWPSAISWRRCFFTSLCMKGQDACAYFCPKTTTILITSAAGIQDWPLASFMTARNKCRCQGPKYRLCRQCRPFNHQCVYMHSTNRGILPWLTE